VAQAESGQLNKLIISRKKIEKVIKELFQRKMPGLVGFTG
jgi:hypothetical protein